MLLVNNQPEYFPLSRVLISKSSCLQLLRTRCGKTARWFRTAYIPITRKRVEKVITFSGKTFLDSGSRSTFWVGEGEANRAATLRTGATEAARISAG